MKIIVHKRKLIIGTIRQIKEYLNPKPQKNDKKRMAKHDRGHKSYNDSI